MTNYKLHLPKHTIYHSASEKTNRTTWLDYWTTITTNDNATDNEIIRLGKDNLRKQIAMSELFEIKLWQTISFDSCEIEIVKAQKGELVYA